MFKFDVWDKVRITDEDECYVDDPKMVADHVKDHYNATCYCMSSQPSDGDVGQILARWEDSGQNIYYVRLYEDDNCEKPSCYCYCMDEAGLEIFKEEIKVGDMVRIERPSDLYSNYSDWVVKNIDDKQLLAHWMYDSRVMDNQLSVYEVVKIAPHSDRYKDRLLAFIKSTAITTYRCYLVDVNGLAKTDHIEFSF